MTYNPSITISKPFPEADLPTLYGWIQASARQMTCDQTPATLEAWMEWQLGRMNPMQIVTWGVYLDGVLAGYFEMMPHFLAMSDSAGACLVPAMDKIAEGHGIFKREMYGRDKTQTAINLALQEVFAAGVETMIFSPFSHNRLMIALHKSLGGHFGGSLGEIATQDGKPIEGELWVLTKREWVKANSEWVQEYATGFRSETIPSPEERAEALITQFA